MSNHLSGVGLSKAPLLPGSRFGLPPARGACSETSLACRVIGKPECRAMMLLTFQPPRIALVTPVQPLPNARPLTTGKSYVPDQTKLCVAAKNESPRSPRRL